MQKKILIVEHEVPIAEGLARRLRGRGYQPEVVALADDALVAFESHKPDLVVISLTLPEDSGQALCRSIRRQPLGTLVPILYLGTGQESIRSAHDAIAAGADHYFTKPEDISDLLGKVAVYIGPGDPGAPATDLSQDLTLPFERQDTRPEGMPTLDVTPPLEGPPPGLDAEVLSVLEGGETPPERPDPEVARLWSEVAIEATTGPTTGPAAEPAAEPAQALVEPSVEPAPPMSPILDLTDPLADPASELPEVELEVEVDFDLEPPPELPPQHSTSQRGAPLSAAGRAAAAVLSGTLMAGPSRLTSGGITLQADAPRSRAPRPAPREHGAPPSPPPRTLPPPVATPPPEMPPRPTESMPPRRRASDQMPPRPSAASEPGPRPGPGPSPFLDPVLTPTPPPPLSRPTPPEPPAWREPTPERAPAPVAGPGTWRPPEPPAAAEDHHLAPLDLGRPVPLAQRGFGEILATASYVGLSGRVELAAAGVLRRVFLEAGRPVYIDSSDPGEDLAGHLAEEGLIDRSMLHQSRSLARQRQQPTEELLLEMGYARPEEIYRALSGYVMERVLALFALESGEAAIMQGGPGAIDPVDLGVHPGRLILDGVRRKYGRLRLFRVFGTTTTVPRPRPGASLPPGLTLRGDEHALLQAIDGRRTVSEAARAIQASEMDALAMLYAFGVLGLIEAGLAGRRGTGLPPLSPESLDRAGTAPRTAEQMPGFAEMVEIKHADAISADYYKVLGVPRSATSGEIRAAHERLKRQFDPHRVRQDGSFYDKVREIADVVDDACALLADERLRALYTQTLE